MEKLLKRWAKLEPERCKSSVYITLIKRDGQIMTDSINLGRIEIDARQAIEARGWSWHVGTAPLRGYGADVDTEPGLVGYRKHGDTPAEALLRAYLAALESIATEDADAS